MYNLIAPHERREMNISNFSHSHVEEFALTEIVERAICLFIKVMAGVIIKLKSIVQFILIMN